MWLRCSLARSALQQLALRAWIVTEDNPLHIKTANCPYISEVSGDTVSLVGKCAWTDGEDDIFTDWNTTFLASKGLANGAQTFTGGSGKFSGIQGSNPFQCQLVGKEGQFLAPKTGLISRTYYVYPELRLARRSKGIATEFWREQRSISAGWWQSNSERGVQAAMAEPLGR